MSETKIEYIKKQVRNALQKISESECVINLVGNVKLHIKVSYQDNSTCFDLNGRTICEEIDAYVANVPDGGYFTIEIEDMVFHKSFSSVKLSKRHWLEMKKN